MRGTLIKLLTALHGPPLDGAAAAGAAPVAPKHPSIINLLADGEIIDLNRSPLPADTVISDQRFEAEKAK